MTVFASYKTGFLPGGFSLGATPQAGLTLKDFQFDSEEVEGWELGFKSKMLDDRLSLDVIGYDYKFTNLQVNLYVPATASFIVGNAGEATTTGIEANLRWQATDNFSLRTFATYNNGEYGGYRTQCYTLQTAAQGCDPATGTQDLDGKSLPRAPERTFGVGGIYTADVGIGRLSLGADAYWSDEYQIETTNNPYLVQDSYWRFDASVALESNDGHWRGMLIGRNLTDEVITSFGATRGFSTDQLAELMPLRQVSAQLTYSF
jgi:outer membrane receptor protein involved in Fe transport